MIFTHLLAVFCAIGSAQAHASNDTVPCYGEDDGPLQVTADCVDPTYHTLIIDAETDEGLPVPHRKISGHFNDTDVTVNFYLPRDKECRGRFFQLAYPTNTSDATDESIAFAADSRAYTVQVDGTLGYRADAAAAKFSRQYASEYYGNAEDHIFGYIYGGSGGSFQVVGGMENTEGVWDGAIAFVQGIISSHPPAFTIKALAALVLANKSEEIMNAMSPGGSGDPEPKLSPLEKQIWREAKTMGIPVKTWEDFDTADINRMLISLNATYRTFDSTIQDDFWTLPGYAGTEESELGDFMRSVLVNFTTTVEDVLPPSVPNEPPTVVLADLPPLTRDDWLDFNVISENGTRLGPVWGALDAKAKTFSPYPGSDPAAISALAEGQKIAIDNKWFLASTTYHRHQLPSRDGVPGFDQFLNSEGKPLYPQRSPIAAELLSESVSGGGTHTGNITGKLIVLDTLYDRDAFPVNAVWYRDQVRNALGDDYEDTYRLWYLDNSDHEFNGVKPGKESMLVPYRPALHFTLRELAAWAEDGKEPPQSSKYEVEDSQILIPDTANERHGIQVVANLTVNDTTSAEAHVGEEVMFRSHIEVPEGVGKIVAVHWDPFGHGNSQPYPLESPALKLDIDLTARYNSSGTYFPAVMVESQREGKQDVPWARTLNLGRARVVVHSGGATTNTLYL